MLTLSERHLQSKSPHYYLVYLVAAVISVMLSIWINLREGVINPDAICYLLSAQTITEHGLKAGMQFCPQAAWPLYSWLLSLFVKLTHLSYEHTAYLLDGFFTLISVMTFIAIIDTIGASKRVLILAAAVILLSHEFNYVRQYIVRDHGFWAFYLVSLLCMLRFMLSNRFAWALAWSMSIALATLFRIEGAIFMLTLPFAAFFMSWQGWVGRFKSFITLNLLTIVSGIAIIGWLLLHPEATVGKLGRLHEVFDQMQAGMQLMGQRYQAMRTAIIEHVLTLEAARDASVVLVITLITWYLLNVLGNLSWIYSALVGYAWLTRAAKFARPALVTLVAYLLVNLFVTSSFFAEHLFLAKRYLIAFTLTLMIWVPYALDRLIEKSTTTRYRALAYVAAGLVFISAVGGIFDFGYSKLYIRQAGTWIAGNVPANAKLYVNDPQLMYYSEHRRDTYFYLKPMGEAAQYDYIALRFRHGESQAMMQPVVAEFANKHGDKVIIYKLNR